HRGQHEHAGAVPGRVHPGHRGPGHAVHLDEAVLVHRDPGRVQAAALGARDHAHGHQAVAAAHGPAVGQGHGDAVPVTAYRVRPGLAEDPHAAAPEHVLDQVGRV